MSGGNYIVSKHFKSLGIAIAVFLWLTLGCFGAGLAGNAWVVITTFVQPNNQTASITIGLWKNCTTINNLKNCTTTQLKDFLTFKNVTGTDPIMICLLISSGCILIVVLVLMFTGCCCRRRQHLWRKGVKSNIVFLVIALTAAVDAMLYTELSFFQSYPSMLGHQWYNGRGWSYMVSWAGTGTLLLAFLLTLGQLCTFR